MLFAGVSGAAATWGPVVAPKVHLGNLKSSLTDKTANNLKNSAPAYR